MIYAPRINQFDAAEGVTRIDVADEHGEFLGTVTVHTVYRPPRTTFNSAIGVNWTADQLVHIAKFMREKADAK